MKGEYISIKTLRQIKKQRDNIQTSALQLDKIVKEKQEEIEKLQRQKEELQINGLRQETLFKLEIERLNNNIEILNGDLWNIAKLLDLEEGDCVEDILDKIKELKGSDKE